MIAIHGLTLATLVGRIRCLWSGIREGWDMGGHRYPIHYSVPHPDDKGQRWYRSAF